MILNINEHMYEVEKVLQVKDGTFNIQFINTDKEDISVARRHIISKFKTYGIKRVTATEAKHNKFKSYYKKLKVEFHIDGRRYITLPNGKISAKHFADVYENLFKIWQQCITVLKMIESKNIVDVKTFIDDMKFDYLIKADIDNIVGLSRRMKSKISYVRHLYNKV